MRRAAARCALLVGTAATLTASPLQAQEALVLSGGGGRGIAHAGVLLGLEERGYSPGMVVGTSMGSIVGALYAAGIDPDSIAAIVTHEDWRALFAPDVLAVGPDRIAVRPLVSFGVGDDGIVLGGVVPDAGINRRLVEMLFDAGARARSDFDRLPRRYRAVAADLRDGSVVVLGHGDLARAVRASMAVPGVFSPVVIDGRILVDGGIADNLPTTQARALGALYIIASDVLLPELDELPTSRVAIGVRALRLLIENASPSGPEPDVFITPRIPEEISAATFPADTRPLIDIGREAALAVLPARSAAQPSPAPTRLDALADTVVVEGDDARINAFVHAAFAGTAGAYDADRIVERARRLYATGMFRGVWPRVEDRDGDATLIVRTEAVPASIVALAAGWDDRRGARGLLTLRQRIRVGGPGEFRASAGADRFLRRGALEASLPFARQPALSVGAGVHYSDRDVPRFTPAGEEVNVERRGAWFGGGWRTPDARYNAALQWVLEHARYRGTSGTTSGPRLRFTESPPYPLIAGEPLLLDAGVRFGEMAYAHLHARASVEQTIGRITGAILLDAAVTGSDAPPDAQFALGDIGGLPWLETGAERGTRRLIVGADVAYRIFLDGAVRLRIRSGAVGNAFDDLENDSAWHSGVEVGAIWPTPFGVLAGGFAAGSDRKTRFTIDIGSSF